MFCSYQRKPHLKKFLSIIKHQYSSCMAYRSQNRKPLLGEKHIHEDDWEGLERIHTCMFDDKTSFLLIGISGDFLYIHRHISQGLGADFWGRFFYIHTGMCFHQILCWPHMNWGKVCFYRRIGMNFCPVLCKVHNWMAGVPLYRHTDMFLHPIPCWVHRHHEIHLTSLDKQWEHLSGSTLHSFAWCETTKSPYKYFSYLLTS